MSDSRRRAPRKRRGLWGLVSRLFGKPRGRHVLGAPPPPPPRRVEAPPAEATVDPAEAAILEGAVTSLVSEAASFAAPPQEETMTAITSLETASVRLIFVDGSVEPLPEGSAEERQAEYLARRVLDATRRHAG
jgi:hypothetical protein